MKLHQGTALRGRAAAAQWRRRSRWLLTATLLSCCGASALAETTARFTRFGAEEGLSQGAIHAITQDPTGFIWIATEDGLNRYDGYSLTHIMRDRNAVNGLPNNWVAALAQDPQGQLWVGTAGGGVTRRDSIDGRFYPLLDARGKLLVDPRAQVRVLRIDADRRLWIGTRNAGLRVVDLRSKEAREYRRDLTSAASLSDDSIFAVASDLNGATWVGTAAGLDSIESASGRITAYTNRLTASLGVKSAQVKVQALLVDSRGALWIGTDHGLAHFDPVSDAFDVIRKKPGDNSSLPSNNVTAILEDTEQRLWVGTTDGLALLDRRTYRLTSFRNAPADLSSLPDNHVVSLFQDRSGLLWVGTKSGGTARWNPRSWSFGHQQLGQGDDNNIASFVEDRQGTLWVGTMGSGLFAQNRLTGALTRYRHDPRRANSLSDDNVMALAADDTHIWIGTMTAGVARLNPRSGEFKRFAYDPANPASLGAPGVMSMLRDSRGRIWVGTYGGGIARIDADTDKVTRYPIQRNGSPGLSSDRATALAEDRTGLIWIGTDGGGLNVLDPASGRFRAFTHAPDDPRSLSADTVYAVHVDERGGIWVGTRGGGLDRVIGTPAGKQPLVFRNYSESDGLPNSTVYGIESSARGLLWLSTNRGLARLNPADGQVRSFGRSQGLQSDEFNFGAHYQSPSGELFFGGARGYNAFYPDRLRFNELPPPVVLTQFARFNSPVDFGRSLSSIARIGLSYRDDVVTFGFAALDFTAPAANSYMYMLEGFDKTWVQAHNERQATYTNLAGGQYVFRVRAANSDGVWNERGLALPLDVATPPWQTWWAYGLYALCFVLALFAVWAAQQRKLQREAAYTSRLSAEVAQRTEELAQRNTELEAVNRQLQDASITDPLTGLGNRRFLHNAISKIFAQHAAAGVNAGPPRFVFIIVDLDNLKPINDEHGHEGGDNVLVQVSDILKRLCRASDFVVRWGGDEFVMMCHGADLDTAAVLAERLRATIAKQIFRAHAGQAVRTSCSIGFAPFPFVEVSPDSVSWEQALALADYAMYQAKRSRNDWLGWAGTALAADVPNLDKLVESDHEALARQGILEIRRRSLITEDTVDNLRALSGRNSGDA